MKCDNCQACSAARGRCWTRTHTHTHTHLQRLLCNDRLVLGRGIGGKMSGWRRVVRHGLRGADPIAPLLLPLLLALLLFLLVSLLPLIAGVLLLPVALPVVLRVNLTMGMLPGTLTLHTLRALAHPNATTAPHVFDHVPKISQCQHV